MTRVLIVEAAGNLWGSERSLLDLLAGVPSLEVAVCCPPHTRLNEELDKRGVRTLPYYVYGLHERSRLRRLQAAFGVLRACLAFRPDVIHLNQSGSYRVVLPAATLMNIPIVAHIRIFEDVEYLAAHKPSTRRLRGLIAISGAVEAEIRRFPALASIPVHRIYNAYVSSAGSKEPWPADDASYRAQRIACVGRLVPIKAQDVLIQALALLRDEGINPDCLMVGNGDADFVEQVKTLAIETGVAPAIQWLGFVENIVPLVRSCAVLVCPSHREPLGRVIFEAWDAGAVPVVYAGSGGAAEMVRAASAGLVYDEQTPDELAAALRTALQLSAETRAEMVERGRAWTARNCDTHGYGTRVSAIFSGVADAVSSPGFRADA